MAITSVLLVIAMCLRIVTITVGTVLGVFFEIALAIEYSNSQDSLLPLDSFLIVSYAGVGMVGVTGSLTIFSEIIACVHKYHKKRNRNSNDDRIILHGIIVGAAVYVGLWFGIFVCHLYIFSRVMIKNASNLNSTFTAEGTLSAGLLLLTTIVMIFVIPRIETSARKILLYTAPNPERRRKRQQRTPRETVAMGNVGQAQPHVAENDEVADDVV